MPALPQKNNRNNQNGRNHHNNNNSSNDPNRTNQVSDVALWETQGVVKIFSGCRDGSWRLYDTSKNFALEFEVRMSDSPVDDHDVSSEIGCVEVASDYLFCGFESVLPGGRLPGVPVGRIRAWNLNSPSDPPLEFARAPSIPYAHDRCVDRLAVLPGGAVVSGGRDAVVRLWRFDTAASGFSLVSSLDHHARAVTALAVSDATLWTASVDRTVRLWDLAAASAATTTTTAADACRRVLSTEHDPRAHADAVTSLCPFDHAEHGRFVLSASLDGHVKAWRGDTGECVADENRGAGGGVASMVLSHEPGGAAVVLLGLENGCVAVCNVLQTKSHPAFTLLLYLNAYSLNVGHYDWPVRCVRAGPSGTFYTGGQDGQLVVWQFTKKLCD